MLKTDNIRHLDENQVDIYVSYESSAPIDLRRYKEIWETSMGLRYDEHYAIIKNGQIISDDKF